MDILIDSIIIASAAITVLIILGYSFIYLYEEFFIDNPSDDDE